LKELITVPHALEIEESILCSIITDFENLIKAAQLLKPKHFFNKNHQIIYKSIYDMYEASEPVEVFSLYVYLKKLELSERIGGLKYLSKLTSVMPAKNIQFNCKVVIEKWMLREIIATSQRLAQSAYSQTEDVFELASKGVSDFEQIMSVQETGKEEINFYDRLPKLIDQIIKDRDENKDAGLKVTEFPSFNYATLGLKPGNLVVISGKYKSGKTRFGLSLLRDFGVLSKIPVALIFIVCAK
jgi:replicative DNA helicase